MASSRQPVPSQVYERDGYTISTDFSRLNFDFIYTSLTTLTDWARNRPRDVMEKAVEHSLNFGLYHGDQQVGYARVVTDYATFAWLCDVIITVEHRKRGLSKWLVDCVINHPDLKVIRRVLLAT